MSLLIKALKQAERQHAAQADAAATPQDTTDATLALINAAGTATAAMPPRTTTQATLATQTAAPNQKPQTPMQALSMESSALEFAPLEDTKTPQRPATQNAATKSALASPAAAAFASSAATQAAPVRPAASNAQAMRAPWPPLLRWSAIGGVAVAVLIGVFAFQWFATPNDGSATQRPADSVATDTTPLAPTNNEPAAPASAANTPKKATPSATTTAPTASSPRVVSNTNATPKPVAPAVPKPEAQTASTEAAFTATGVGSAVRFLRSEPQSEQLMRTLQDAYAALRANNFETARQKYEQALSIDRNHIDAWLGMATLAVKANDAVLAQRYYQRVLEIDPNDATARSGLMNLRAGGDTAAEESQLRSLLAHNAQQPAVHFALGNLLAAQSRWNEAQQSYFNALNGDPVQPDYAFNLAVSLDRMRQPQLALQFYRKALELAQQAPARFDRAAVQARIAALTVQ